jgi:hypothetical protein
VQLRSRLYRAFSIAALIQIRFRTLPRQNTNQPARYHQNEQSNDTSSTSYTNTFESFEQTSATTIM